MKVVRIDHQVDPEDMVVCPICSSLIVEGEMPAIGRASGVICLIHETCYEEED